MMSLALNQRVRAVMRDRRCSFREACSLLARGGWAKRRREQRQQKELQRGRAILERMGLE